MDKNRVEHIDDMQYLREKVGLMGYAQLDPLVIYKKESYDKYQALLDTIHTTTIITIANIDFEQVAQHIATQQQAQINFNIANETTNSEEDIIAKLRSASQEAPKTAKAKPNTQPSSSEFEIIDKSKKHQLTSSPNRQLTKLRPNDKINVRYTDGKTLRDVKYKTVKEDLQSSKCQIV